MRASPSCNGGAIGPQLPNNHRNPRTDTATNSRELELVVLGATGFTGRQAAQWFSRWASANRPELRWAIAARNSERLQAVAETLSDGPTPTQIVLDTADEQGCRALAERTSTLLTTVGPYARYGSHVIAACAQAGTDYVDITGETPWVRQMLDAHQDAALASGAKIVPLCGFDSIPSDVGAYLVCRALQAAGTEPTAVKSNYSIKGGFNGGTLASALNMMELKQGRALYHPHLLTPKAGRAHLSDRQPRDVQPPRYDEEMETWVTPFIMAPINTRVVRRSAALLGMRGQGYGDKFQYSEFMRTRSAVQAWTVTSALGTINWLGRSGWGRGLLKAVPLRAKDRAKRPWTAVSSRHDFGAAALTAKWFERWWAPLVTQATA